MHALAFASMVMGGAALAAAPVAVSAAQRAPSAERLEKVVILTRHGVRSAMSTPEQLGRYTARPWPSFTVQPGELTPRGAALMRQMGRYYQAYYRRAGLLTEHDCAVYFHANHVPRTRDTAKALAEGLTPDCSPPVHEGPFPHDPLFEAREAGILAQDANAMLAAIQLQAGGSLQRWEQAHQHDLAGVQRLLWQCASVCTDQDRAKVVAASEVIPVRLTIAGQPPHLELSSPALSISGIAESLLMGWADGHDFAAMGWHGVQADRLTTLFRLHAAAQRLRMGHVEAGKQNSLCLAAQIATLLQTRPITAPCMSDPAMGQGAKMVVISGHDGTLMMLAGLFGLRWKIPGYGVGQAVPGGALVFERWRNARTGYSRLKVFYVAQSLHQLRNVSALSLASPPFRQRLRAQVMLQY